MKRIRRRWHRWGRLRWYLGTHGDYGYGWGLSKSDKPRAIRLGKLYITIWPRSHKAT